MYIDIIKYRIILLKVFEEIDIKIKVYIFFLVFWNSVPNETNMYNMESAFFVTLCLFSYVTLIWRFLKKSANK